MGGKSKQARVKNNAKPSNSSRSAELFSTVPTFVGFSAHADHGLIPFASGFSDNVTDSLEQPILDPQLQLILRKMSKKDPVTKVKALQEFAELLKSYDMETTKSLLPIWPKLYQNLAIDVDHRVREGAQEIMQKFTSKCKKAVAPFLKQLVPVWLASSFDNYAPAASIANASFKETFGDKISDVCMHCRLEIIEYTGKNLTFHTASTLTMSKNCTPEEAEQKYQRIVCCSLKTLSFFLQKTNSSAVSNVHQNMQEIIGNAKFWSFAKSKVTSVKASWFELLYYLLQTNDLNTSLNDHKMQLISVCFQNLDESEPLIAPHVWGCILLVQSIYDDWFEVVNLKKVILPKLSSLLRNGCNNNTNAICPNLLPFLSKITQESLKEINLNDFQKQFFDDIFIALTTLDNKSKSDYSAITAAYFECLRFVIQQINLTIQSEKSVEQIESLKALAKRLLNENIIDLLTMCLISDGFVVKYIIQHSSLLIAFWADPAKDSKLYSELLEIFWTDSIAFITENLEKEKDDDIFLNNLTELIEKLYSVNSKIEDQRVKFALEVDEFTTELDDDDDDDNDGIQISAVVNFNTNEEKKSYTKVKSNKLQIDPMAKKLNTASYIECELKSLVLQLVRLCLTKCTKELSSKYIIKVHQLTNLFCDADFYQKISEEKNLSATLDMLLKTLGHLEDDEACDHGIEIIFNALNFLEKEQKFNFIITNLLKNQKPSIQLSTLNRLLSHPLNVEPDVHLMLAQPEAIDLVIKVANEAICENSKNSFNLLRKCFFQTDTGDIPINSKAVDSILEIVSRPLLPENKMEHLMDSCGSFIAQIMPVICSGKNSSLQIQRDIFLKLFKFSIEHSPDDFISEDTLWEISTCWQDALSSKDILTDTKLLQSCKTVVENCLQKESLTFESIDSIAGAITQFVICSTEHITDEENCFQQIDITINEFLRHNELTFGKIKKTQELCLFLEGLQGEVTVDEELHGDCMKHTENAQAYHQVLLNSCILYKLICKPGIGQIHSSYENLDNENIDHCPDEDVIKNSRPKQWSDTLYNETLRCIGMASVADAFLQLNSQIKPNLESVFVQLSEKVKMLLREADEDFIVQLKELMWNRAAKNTDTTACRSLLYILYTNQYEQFEENAAILLLEELSEYFVTQNSLSSYVKTLQYLLPKLISKAITTQMPIMRTTPNKTWIKAVILRCLVQNNFNSDFNEKSDHNIIAQILQFLSEISQMQHANREIFLYNVELHKQPLEKIVDTIELMNLLLEVLKNFPYELAIKNWDTIRIGLSSWVLSVSKSIEQIKFPHVSLFVANVFQLYAALQNFIIIEKQKSSTEFLKNIIDEWDNLFARDVNLVLFKSFYKLVDTKELADSISTCYEDILERITPAIELLDYGVIFNFYKSSTKTTIENVMNFLLKNLSNNVHCIRICCAHILKKFTPYFVASDIEIYENKSESININAISGDWHFLSRFEDYIGRYEILIRKYLDEFNFKLTDLADMKPIDRNEALAYLLLWECIVYVCSNSPITLRSLYTHWLHEKRYEENLLHFLFRAMPTEILKNHDSKLMTTDVFKGFTCNQIKDKNLVVEKYACHMYTEVLRKLPAVVRKWWNSCQSRQKTFIDKLTTNFVSPIICSEELKGIASKKEKHENMLVTVHTSTREVLAVYSIDEARMELVITLAVNYPLGSVKVESGKQIGGRLSSRNIGMQLTIFLTHQNGSIFDGLTLWKNNLDKKFEGVEECYVCYTVIHQDTCQLPKLTCKTCKKKFHGPCLYKWFTTSSKSTCPICRNVF